jgi:GNAT superfamily N-acetyltransferase
VLVHHGFSRSGDGVVQCWLDASARPEVSPLPAGCRLLDRGETSHLAHHMAHEGRPDVDQRLRETPLYRPDLDLVVMCDGTDPDGAAEQVAAHGLFWYDEVTATGVVEPMRTLDGHQRRGLARHVLTTGIDRLAAAGATRISIAFEPDNTAARRLYLDVGFVPHRQTDAFSRQLA